MSRLEQTKKSKAIMSENLIELRKAKKLTQIQVAEYLNVNRSTYTKYETGVSEPNIDTMKKLAELFEVDVNALVTDKSKGTAHDDAAQSSGERERALLSMYRRLDDTHKKRLLAVAKRLVQETARPKDVQK